MTDRQACCTATASALGSKRLVNMTGTIAPTYLYGTVNITLDRCDFVNFGGCIGAGDATASTNSVNITATNTIWRGSTIPPVISVNGSRLAGASAMR